jgi:hypothetical protein
VGAAGTAHAGAWVAAEGGRSITSLGYTQDGPLRGYETDVFIEQPLNDRFAAVAQTYYAQDNFGRVNDETQAAIKGVIARRGGLIAAGQLGVTYDSIPQERCDRVGGEARALVGYATRSGRSYVNFESAFRYAAGCPHVRYELTLGTRPAEGWLLLGQVFADDDLKFDESLKIQAGAVRFGRRERGVQLSVRATLDGTSVIEPTLILGYWSAIRR